MTTSETPIEEGGTALINDCRELVRIVARLSESIRGTECPIHSSLDVAEDLALKLVLHASSAVHLTAGTPVPLPGETPVVGDHASIAILARACLDIPLLLQALLCDTRLQPDERSFRVFVWRLRDLHARRKVLNLSPKLRSQAEGELKEIEALQERLRATRTFQGLSDPDTKQALLNGKRSIFDIVGLGGVADRCGYGVAVMSWRRQLNSHVHSGPSSVAHIRAPGSLGVRAQDMSAPMWSIAMALAVFAEGFSGLFREAQDMFNRDEAALRLVRLYCELAAQPSKDRGVAT